MASVPLNGFVGNEDEPDPLDHAMLEVLYGRVASDSSDLLVESGITALSDVRGPLSLIGTASRADDVEAKRTLTQRAIALTAALLVPDGPGVNDIAAVLSEASEHALHGKGQERHRGEGDNFRDEHWYEVCTLSGADFLYGQAAKKLLEHQRLEPEHARAEVLGAINYLAFAAMLNELRVS